jgi:hypothetical protein
MVWTPTAWMPQATKSGRRIALILREQQRPGTALVALWRDLKRQETDNIKRVKQAIAEEVRTGCF